MMSIWLRETPVKSWTVGSFAWGQSECFLVHFFFFFFFVCVFISRCGGSSERDSAPPLAHLESPGQGSVSQALYLPTHTQEHYEMSHNTVFTQQAAHVLCTLSRQLSNTYLEIALSDLFHVYVSPSLYHVAVIFTVGGTRPWLNIWKLTGIRTGHRVWNLSFTLMCMRHE